MVIKKINYAFIGISLFAAAYAFAEDETSGKVITIDQAYTAPILGTSDGEVINGDLHMNMTGGSITVGNNNVIRGVVNNATVNGNVYIDITGGDIIHTDSLYGSFGINPGDFTQWAQTELERGVITGNTYVSIDMNNTSATNVYGGGNIGGNTNVSIKNGKFAFVVGGGIGTNVSGSSTINVSGGKIERVIGGANGEGKVVGNKNINISSGNITYVIGGSQQYQTGFSELISDKAADTNINLTGGTIGQIRGGSNAMYLLPANAGISGNVNINIGGDTVVTGFSDAVRGAGGSRSSVAGAVNITIDGNASVSGNIYAGARDDRTAAEKAEIGTDIFVGSTNVKIKGGSVVGNVYAGGSFDKISTIVKTDTYVELDGGTVNGNVFGAGKNDIVKGNTTVAILGNGTNVSGTIYGGGEGTSVVNGTKTLNIGTSEKAYTGTSAINVASFDTINVNNAATNAQFSGAITLGTEGQASVMNIASGATVKADSITINTDGALMLTLGKSNQIDSKVVNNGKFAVTAIAGLAEKDYDITSGGISGNDAIAYGGTIVGNVFTIGSVSKKNIDVEGDAIVVENNGIVSLAKDGIDNKVELAFNADKATISNVETKTVDLINKIGNDFKAVEAYDFSVSDMKTGDTVVISFLVNDASLNLSNFTIFHKGNGAEDSWGEAADISNLSYDGETLSFIASHFSSYGYAAVPEPATLAAVIGALALGLVIYRRRK